MRELDTYEGDRRDTVVLTTRPTIPRAPIFPHYTTSGMLIRTSSGTHVGEKLARTCAPSDSRLHTGTRGAVAASQK